MAKVETHIDVTEIEGMADDLLKLDTRAISAAARRAVNTVVTGTFGKVVSRITKGINLSDAYVRDRMYVEPARSESAAVVRAEIIAPGPGRSKSRKTAGGPITSLRNYAPVQLMQPVKWNNASIASKIGKFGPNPRKQGAFLPWKARIGDAQRGIPVDQKQAGVSVEVTRGQRKKVGLRNAFLMPVKRGKALDTSRLGVFTRDPGDAKKQVRLLLGPSVYQLLNSTAPAMLADVQRDLRDAALAEVGKAVNEALT